MVRKMMMRPVLGFTAVIVLGGCTAIMDRYSGRGEACAILAVGVPAQARIVRLVDSGITINDDPVVDFILEVQPPQGPTYSATSRALVSRLELASVQPGRVLPVRYDPDQPQRVAMDWWQCPPDR